MKKQTIIRSIFILFFGILISPQLINAQYENVNTQELKTSALSDFNEGKYSLALDKYSALIKKYPKDGVFNYYSGLCLYYMNKNLPDAIQFLKLAISRPNVPSDVWYYLGEAYMKNYQFPEAKKAYSQFNDVATKAELKEKTPARKAEMAENAIELLKHYNIIDIITTSLFSFSDSGYFKHIAAAGGVLRSKPGELKSTLESSGDLSGLCFIPRNFTKGDYIYYSGYGKTKRGGLDLFRVKMLGEKRFSDPESIKSLNSDYDEILPYYDPVGRDLYFASQGYSSIGGFDIFKSHYKQEDNSWSEPQNLGFPVNSPSNEYIFIPGADLGMVLLITDRQGLDSMLTVYLLHIKEPKQQNLSTDYEELKTIGKFGGIESIPDMVNISAKGIPVADSVVSAKKVEYERPVIKRGIQYSEEYKQYVKEALNFQFKSDSLDRLARESRINVKSVPDPDQRWLMQSSIISWEKQSADYQNKANEYYAKVEKLERNDIVEKKITEPVEKDTVINNITTYRFRTETSSTKQIAEETSTSLAETPATTSETNISPLKIAGQTGTSSNEKSGVVNDFQILDQSPYSSSDQIPKDITIPPGAFYRIQIGVFSQKPGINDFGGFSPITAESVSGRPLTRYYAGKFTSLESVRSALNIVKSKGFKDAFIVGWYNGQKMAVDKVSEFEKRDLR